MKNLGPVILSTLLVSSPLAYGNERSHCVIVDPIKVELGGKNYSIPAKYQPRFNLNEENKDAFYIFEQTYYQDGKRLKNRYCRRSGQQKVDGINFQLEFGTNRRRDVYDVRDAVMSGNTPAFDALENVSDINIMNVPSSNDFITNNLSARGYILSESGLYYFQNSPDGVKNGNEACKSNIVSNNRTPFGDRLYASCYNYEMNPSIYRWRIYMNAVGYGKPHGLLMIDLNQTKFEDWPPVLVTVKKLLESMNDDKR
jgi:hypothetical protein